MKPSRKAASLILGALLGGGLALLMFSPRHQAPPVEEIVAVPDERNASSLLEGLERFLQPSADLPEPLRAGYERIRNGPRDLEEQRRLARTEGLAVTPEDWRPRDLPDNRNAAGEYQRIRELIDQQPLDRQALYRIGVRKHPSAEEAIAARRLLVERRDLLELAHRAAGKPGCDFRRDWSLGDRLLMPEHRAMRETRLLLRTEAILQAREGDPTDAVRMLAGGFQVAAFRGRSLPPRAPHLQDLLLRHARGNERPSVPGRGPATRSGSRSDCRFGGG